MLDPVIEPPGAVTTMSAKPAVPAGAVQVSWVFEVTASALQGCPPMVTAVAPVNPVPMTVTVLPPAGGTAPGNAPEIVGPDRKVKSPVPVPVPPAVVTTTLAVPKEPAAVTHVADVGELTTNPVHVRAPIFTSLAPVKLVPVMATEVPPVAGPDVGATDVTVGNDA
jgi:hypothetical protein